MSYVAPAAAATPPKTLHGNNGTLAITVSGGTKTEFNVTKCNFSYEVETERIDNSGVPGWAVQQAGQQMIEGTIEFIYDVANNPLLSPYAIFPGSLNTYEINLNAVSTANAITPLNTQLWAGPAMIKNLKFPGAGPTAGTQRVTADFSSSGVWTIPIA